MSWTVRDLQTEAEAALFHETAALHFGEGLVVSLYRLLKGASLYHHSNEILARLAHECLLALHDTVYAAGSELVTLQIAEGAVFCNRRRVRISAETLAPCKAFIKLLRRREIGLLEFSRELTADALRDLAFFCESLEERQPDNPKQLNALLARHGIAGLRVDGLENGLAGPDSTDARRRRTKEVYFSTIGAIKELASKMATGHELELRRVKRLMMNTVSLIEQEESSLLGLANIKSYDDYTFTHSVNVAIIAVALGQRVGLPRVYLYYLGICGLFHDIGKQAVPLEILNKPGKLEPEEWEVIRTHPVRGAEMAMMQRAWGELLSHIMAGSFEHHVKYNGSGYPPLSAPRRPSLFSRIITIADCYDALSRPRIYRNTPYLSEKILGMFLQQADTDFDPTLVKLLVNMVGVYPLGALVLLDNGDKGIVTAIPPDPELIDHPQVCLLHLHDGRYEKGETLDLTETDPASGAFRRNILRTLDPNEYGVSIEEFYI